MKATEANLLKFLGDTKQFEVPIYQRTYSWSEKQCEILWKDILDVGNNDAVKTYFIGSVVYMGDALVQVTDPKPLLLIDGQQRLTTILLILEAIARVVEVENDEPVRGFSAPKLRDNYLLEPHEEAESAHKLLLTQNDRDTLVAIVRNECKMPELPSIRVRKNFELIQKWVGELGASLKPLCKGLAKLTIVDVALTQGIDNPQLIFESMNYKIKELSQVDLIRNFILMGLDYQHQKRLYKDYWRPMEEAFGQEAYTTHFDPFIRHYLTVKTGSIPNVREVYAAFKTHAHAPKVFELGIDALVADVYKFAGYYRAMALGEEKEPALRAAFADLRELKVDVAYPLLLELYDDYAQKKLLTAEELERAVRLIESYVLRRVICDIPTNPLNKTFASFGKEVKALGNGQGDFKHEKYLLCLELNFHAKSSRSTSRQRFPRNQEFKEQLLKADLYNGGRCRYALDKLEKHYSGNEKIQINEKINIEHIMPQDLTSGWKDSIGENWEQVHNDQLHTLGNLTLTGYNSKYSNKLFLEKRDMEHGFKQSGLWLNERLKILEQWNENEIRNRAEYLADKAISIWKDLSPLSDLKNVRKVPGRGVSDGL